MKFDRRGFRQAFAFLGLVLSFPLFAEPFPVSTVNEPRIRPNLLFLLSDDQRWDAMGCTGNKIIQTPNLDRLAKEGTLFVNNFCATSICAISRASILTGQYARRHKINDFQTSLSDSAFAQTYPALLRKAGYRTGFIGKWGVGNDLPKDKFDYFEGFPGQGTYAHELGGKPIHLTRLQTIQAKEFFKGCRKDQPFCLSISFKAPHEQDGAKEHFFPSDPAQEKLYADITIPAPKTADPRYYDAMPEFLRKSEGHTRWLKQFSTPELYQESVKGIYRLVSGVDEAVGEIRAALNESGFDSNTLIIFTSDNGFFLGERGLQGKWLMYEESIRTPLIIFDPRAPETLRGKRREEMTLNIDLAPTMLNFAGVEVPAVMQGRTLAPLLGNQPAHWRKEWFYDHLFEFGGKIPRSEGVRTEEWKYIRYIETDPPYEELFDLKNDPFEENNLARDKIHEPFLNQMREKWKPLRAEAE